MRTRAWRRHHFQRIKRRAQHVLKLWQVRVPAEDLPRHVGLLANTRSSCSCWMCGNPRHHFREKPIQEQRADIESINNAPCTPQCALQPARR